MRTYLGLILRLIVLAGAITLQIGFLQVSQTIPHPWMNLPLILLLWNGIHKTSPWPLITSGLTGALLDLSTPVRFGVFTTACVLATLAVMVVSQEWFNRRGTGNRILIACLGLLVYGLVWWLWARTTSFPAPFFQFDLLLEILLLWTSFSILKSLRPLWASIIKPNKRYA